MKKDQDMSTVILISSNLLRNKIAVSYIVAWLSEAHNGAWVLIFWSNFAVPLLSSFKASQDPAS